MNDGNSVCSAPDLLFRDLENTVKNTFFFHESVVSGSFWTTEYMPSNT
jgi:hypothetical protein